MNYYGSLGAAGPIGPQPSSNWVVSGSVCKPANASVLALWKSLQSAINSKGGRLSVDGAIGPATVSAYNSLMGGSFSSCSALASSVSPGLVDRVRATSNVLRTPTASGGGSSADPAAPGPLPDLPGGGFFEPFDKLFAGDVMGFVKAPVGMITVAGLGFMVFKIATSGKHRPAAVKISAPKAEVIAVPTPVAATPALTANPWPVRAGYVQNPARRRRRRRR